MEVSYTVCDYYDIIQAHTGFWWMSTKIIKINTGVYTHWQFIPTYTEGALGDIAATIWNSDCMFDVFLGHVSTAICAIFVVFDLYFYWVVVTVHGSYAQWSTPSFTSINSEFCPGVGHNTIFFKTWTIGADLKINFILKRLKNWLQEYIVTCSKEVSLSCMLYYRKWKQLLQNLYLWQKICSYQCWVIQVCLWLNLSHVWRVWNIFLVT